MAAETDKTGFKINGVIYEEPESLTMAEHRIIKRYTGFNLHDLERLLGEGAFADQDLIQASAHIAYRREHRDLSFDEIEEIVGDQDFEEMLSGLGSGEGDVDPPASTSSHDRSSPSGSPTKSTPSGHDSTKSSENSDESRTPTGTSESETLSPQSGQDRTVGAPI